MNDRDYDWSHETATSIEKEACCVVDEGCRAPANLLRADRPRLRAKCFACGEPVCTNCSKRMKYFRYGVRRICNRCQEDQQ